MPVFGRDGSLIAGLFTIASMMRHQVAVEPVRSASRRRLLAADTTKISFICLLRKSIQKMLHRCF
jgi:hypothetical protein